MSLAEPLFTIQQQPLPLSFGLTYHSEAPLYPSLVNEPMGKGW